MDEVCTGVDSRPRTALVVEILNAKLCVWRCPRGLDGRNVAANDTSTRVSLGHFVVGGRLVELESRMESIFQSSQQLTKGEGMIRTIDGPEARAGA